MFILVFILFIPLPYYIDAPGGISDIDSRIEMNSYSKEGSFNITYIKEYKATIPAILFALFNKNWEVLKKDEVLLENEDASDYEIRDKLFMEESISNSIFVAYTKANKKIEIKNTDIKVLYIDKKANTDLKVGDIILEINGEKINNKEDINKLINNYNENDEIKIIVKNNDKKYTRSAKIIELDGEKKLGLLLVRLSEYETEPNIKVKIKKNESGPSGGLITALSIYNNLIDEDLTNGLTIIGTGTIDVNGSVGSVSGIKHKLKTAEENKGDIFFVPNGDNYKEAIKLKQEKKYKIKVVGVSNFDEAINYLKSISKK